MQPSIVFRYEQTPWFKNKISYEEIGIKHSLLFFVTGIIFKGSFFRILYMKLLALFLRYSYLYLTHCFSLFCGESYNIHTTNY